MDKEIKKSKGNDFEKIEGYVYIFGVLMNILLLKGFLMEEFETARDMKHTEKGFFFENIILKD